MSLADYYQQRIAEIRARAASGDFHVEGPHGITLLDEVVWGYSVELVRELLERGANVHHRDARGRTPLHRAALRTSEHDGVDAIIAVLLEAGADPNARDEEGETPLHMAAHIDRPESIERLLRAGADCNARTVFGRTPLHIAASVGLPAVVKRLLDAGARVDVATRDIAGDYRATGSTPLHEAAVRSNENGSTRMIDKLPVVRLLLDHGAPMDVVDNRGTTPLMLAMFWNQLPTAVELLRRGATLSEKVDVGVLMRQACALGSAEAIRALLARGIPASLRFSDHSTALQVAASSASTEAVVALLDGGADVRDVDGWERSALHVACLHRAGEVAEVLLGRGARLDAADRQGETPLHIAARHGYTELVQRLLHRGADVNRQDVGGASALHKAAFNGHEATCSALLAAKVELSLTLKDGRTAADVAGKRVATLLTKAGAVVTGSAEGSSGAVLEQEREGLLDFMEKPSRRLPLKQEPDCVHAIALIGKKLTAVPGEVLGCPNLRELSLAGNRMDHLPEELFTLRLVRADLSDNCLSALPASIQQARTLEELYLQGNPIPVEERQRIRAAMPWCKVVF